VRTRFDPLSWNHATAPPSGGQGGASQTLGGAGSPQTPFLFVSCPRLSATLSCMPALSVNVQGFPNRLHLFGFQVLLSSWKHIRSKTPHAMRPVASKAAPGGLSRKPCCYGEQDSARPSRLLPHVSLGTANLDREEPTAAFPQCTLSPGFGSPPRTSLPTPREPSVSGTRGGGVPLKLRGAGRGFLSPLSSPERLRSVTHNRRRWSVSHNVPAVAEPARTRLLNYCCSRNQAT